MSTASAAQNMALLVDHGRGIKKGPGRHVSAILSFMSVSDEIISRFRSRWSRSDNSLAVFKLRGERAELGHELATRVAAAPVIDMRKDMH